MTRSEALVASVAKAAMASRRAARCPVRASSSIASAVIGVAGRKWSAVSAARTRRRSSSWGDDTRVAASTAVRWTRARTSGSTGVGTSVAASTTTASSSVPATTRDTSATARSTSPATQAARACSSSASTREL